MQIFEDFEKLKGKLKDFLQNYADFSKIFKKFKGKLELIVLFLNSHSRHPHCRLSGTVAQNLRF